MRLDLPIVYGPSEIARLRQYRMGRMTEEDAALLRLPY